MKKHDLLNNYYIFFNFVLYYTLQYITVQYSTVQNSRKCNNYQINHFFQIIFINNLLFSSCILVSFDQFWFHFFFFFIHLQLIVLTCYRQDVDWLGWKPNPVTFTSDYFVTLHQLAIELIKKGKSVFILPCFDDRHMLFLFLSTQLLIDVK